MYLWNTELKGKGHWKIDSHSDSNPTSLASAFSMREPLRHTERIPFAGANSCPSLLAKPYFNRIWVHLGCPGTEARGQCLKLSYGEEYQPVEHCETKNALLVFPLTQITQFSARFFSQMYPTDEKGTFLISRKIPIKSKNGRTEMDGDVAQRFSTLKSLVPGLPPMLIGPSLGMRPSILRSIFVAYHCQVVHQPSPNPSCYRWKERETQKSQGTLIKSDTQGQSHHAKSHDSSSSALVRTPCIHSSCFLRSRAKEQAQDPHDEWYSSSVTVQLFLPHQRKGFHSSAPDSSCSERQGHHGGNDSLLTHLEQLE